MTASALPERYNVSTLLDRNLEAGRGTKAAVVGDDGEVSYERLLAMACAAGRALGALGAGMVPVPLNPLFKPDDYRYLLSDSEARAVVVDLDLLPKVREALAGYGEPLQLVVAGGPAEDAHHLEDLLA